MLASASLCAGRTSVTATSLDALIPPDHIIRRLDAAIDWETRCAPMRNCYSMERGRPAFDPEILLAISLLRHIYHIDSLRAAYAEIETNLVYRWFIGCPLGEAVPHFSTVNANLLHRIPKDVFARAFAQALCDILDAGVLSAKELIYPSPFLTEDGELYALTVRYLHTCEQLPLFPNETPVAATLESPHQLPFPL